jgi:hypothetical protein
MSRVYAEKYDKDKTYFFTDGSYATYETLRELYPAIEDLKWLVYTDYTHRIIISFVPLDLERTELDIDTTLSDEEAIAEIISRKNAPSNQTRMADALEDLVVLNMPDEEV